MLGQRFIRSTGQILMLPIILRPITLIMTKLLLSRLLTVPPSDPQTHASTLFSSFPPTTILPCLSWSQDQEPSHHTTCAWLWLIAVLRLGRRLSGVHGWLSVAELRRLSPKAYIPCSKDLSVAATLSWQQCECTTASCIFNHLYYGRIAEWPLILLRECAWAVLAGDLCRRKLVYRSMSEPDGDFLSPLQHAAAGHRIHLQTCCLCRQYSS